MNITREIPVSVEPKFIPEYPIDLIPVFVFYDGCNMSGPPTFYSVFRLEKEWCEFNWRTPLHFNYMEDEVSNKFDFWHYNDLFLKNENGYQDYFIKSLMNMPPFMFVDEETKKNDYDKTREFFSTRITQSMIELLNTQMKLKLI